ncbi:MAG: tetratricopeptide repeat protein [Acetobacteraceae bacterium]|nr:tetratricopeptide repeat protein [Acetobacteraceae bacterium]
METDTHPEPPPDANAALCHALAEDLHKQGRAGEAETFYRAALALAPQRPDSWANLGLAVLTEGRAEEAIQCEREALRLDPDNVEAHNNLGIVAHALNVFAEAENHFRGALRRMPDHANATLNLGVIRQSLGYPDEAEILYRRARALGVDETRVCNNLALALAEQERLDEAEAACRDALAASPGYPEADVNLGMILLMRGRLTEAWPHYESRWRVPPLSRLPQLPAATRWTGAEPVEGKTILLLAEQGFGDTLQFCRYAPIIASVGAKVVLAVPRVLQRLVGTLQGVDRVIAEDDPLPDHDLHCPLMSLPMIFGTTVETIPNRIPYLSAAPDAVGAWASIIPSVGESASPRIGLAWAGGRRAGQPHAEAIDRRRSMKLSDMAPLAEVPGCVFVSLQLGAPAKQTETASFPLIDVTDRLTDFADTAALIETLDLVITVDTAVAHVAGALGKPVWLLSRFDACWRWLRDRDDTPWYPAMRLFRQTSPGDWAGTIQRVREALSQFRVIG